MEIRLVCKGAGYRRVAWGGSAFADMVDSWGKISTMGGWYVSLTSYRSGHRLVNANTLSKVLLAIIVFILLCMLANAAESMESVEQARLGFQRANDGMDLRWWSVIPPLLAVTMAMATGRVLPSLAAGIIAGGILVVCKGDFSAISLMTVKQGTETGFGYVTDKVFDLYSLKIFLFVLLIMLMISVTVVSGGMIGLVGVLSRFARGPRSTQFVTYLMGLAIFIDDYANTMLIGESMRPLTDRYRVSREKLAFLVDGTAAPVAGLALISTWIGMEVKLFGDAAAHQGFAQDGYTIFLNALPFRFYCMMMIVFMFINVLSGRDYGPMRKAEEDAVKNGPRAHGLAGAAGAVSKCEADPRAKPSAATFFLPLLSVFMVMFLSFWFYGSYNLELDRMSKSQDTNAGPVSAAERNAEMAKYEEHGFHFDYSTLVKWSAWKELIKKVGDNNVDALVMASLSGLIVAVFLAVALARTPPASLLSAFSSGVTSFFIPCAILALAWGLSKSCEALHTGQFVASFVQSDQSHFGIPVSTWFPVATLLTASAIAFATGTSWGTMSILIPIVFPIAWSIDGGAYGATCMISLAAVLDGAILGDHCSPVSDTTILSSFASSCDHIRHVNTQAPYGITVGLLAIVCGYIPASIMAKNNVSWSASLGISLGTAAVVILVIHFLFGKKRTSTLTTLVTNPPAAPAPPAPGATA